MSNRRTFLALSSGAALASALPRSLFAQQTGSDLFSNRNLGAYTQGLLTKANFERVVGSVFTLFYPDGGTASLTLTGVKTPVVHTTAKSTAAAVAASTALSHGTANLAPKRTSSCFLLTFSTGLHSVPQGTYQLDHGTLGSFSVLLVPGDPAHSSTCTACFNYL